MRRWAIPALLLVVGLVSLAGLAVELLNGVGGDDRPPGPTSTSAGEPPSALPTAPPGTTPRPTSPLPREVLTVVGDPATVGTLTVIVHGFRFDACEGEFDRPAPGHTFLVVDLEVSNAPGAAYSARADARVLDVEGRSYRSTSSCSTGFPDASVNPGETSRGELAFEIPGEATGLTLVHGPWPAGDDATVFVVLGE